MAGYGWRRSSERWHPVRKYYSQALYNLQQLAHKDDFDVDSLTQFIRRVMAGDPRSLTEVLGIAPDKRPVASVAVISRRLAVIR